MNLSAHITAFFRSRGVLEAGGSFLVACSGGRDSVALLALMHELARRWSLRVEAASIDHGLRPGAKHETAFVEELGARLHLPVHVRCVQVTEDGAEGSVQSIARERRYQALEEVRRERDLEYILTAHHAGDQAETLLWRFLSGSGIDGLRGIPAVNGVILRPLLEISPSQLAEYVRSAGLTWMEDPSNAGDAYLRNSIRHHLLPVIREHVTPEPELLLARMAGMYSSLAEHLDTQAAVAATDVLHSTEDAVFLAVQPLKGYFEFQQLMLVRMALRQAGIRQPGFDATYAVLDLMNADTGKRAVPGDGFLAFRDREHIVISPERQVPGRMHVRLGERVRFGIHEFTSSRIPLPASFPAAADEEVIDLKAAGDNWLLRAWNPGDRFQPIGLQGTKLVSDLLTDLRVPPQLRSGIAVLEREGDILWVCGLRLAERCRITPTTTDCAIITYRCTTET